MKINNIHLYKDISGNEVVIKTYSYGRGAKGLYIQGGVHGGEVTYFIFEKLNNWLKANESKLKKKVTLVPIVNPIAWNQRVYYYTVGKFDLYKGKDWNRSYGKDLDTLTATVSKKILSIAKYYEFCLDLHTARRSKPYVIFNNQNLKPFLQTLGLEYNVFIDDHKPESVFNGTFNHALNNLGVKSAAIECGSHDSYQNKNIEIVFKSIIQLFIKLGIVNNSVGITQKKQFKIQKVTTIFSPNSGFAKYHLKPHQPFKKNDKLVTIYESENINKKTIVKAKDNGLLFELPKTHIIWQGDELLKVVYKKEILDL